MAILTRDQARDSALIMGAIVVPLLLGGLAYKAITWIEQVRNRTEDIKGESAPITLGLPLAIEIPASAVLEIPKAGRDETKMRQSEGWTHRFMHSFIVAGRYFCRFIQDM